MILTRNRGTYRALLFHGVEIFPHFSCEGKPGEIINGRIRRWILQASIYPLKDISYAAVDSDHVQSCSSLWIERRESFLLQTQKIYLLLELCRSHIAAFAKSAGTKYPGRNRPNGNFFFQSSRKGSAAPAWTTFRSTAVRSLQPECRSLLH